MHRIGIDLTSLNDGFVVVCDADDPKWKDGYIADYTPQWLYDEIYKIDPDCYEEMESVFVFSTSDAIDKLKAIASEIKGI